MHRRNVINAFLLTFILKDLIVENYHLPNRHSVMIFQPLAIQVAKKITTEPLQ